MRCLFLDCVGSLLSSLGVSSIDTKRCPSKRSRHLWITNSNVHRYGSPVTLETRHDLLDQNVKQGCLNITTVIATATITHYWLLSYCRLDCHYSQPQPLVTVVITVIISVDVATTIFIITTLSSPSPFFQLGSLFVVFVLYLLCPLPLTVH